MVPGPGAVDFGAWGALDCCLQVLASPGTGTSLLVCGARALKLLGLVPACLWAELGPSMVSLGPEVPGLVPVHWWVVPGACVADYRAVGPGLVSACW